jgi:TRAP-type C4-dicarboxylate transport system permease small subunit
MNEDQKTLKEGWIISRAASGWQGLEKAIRVLGNVATVCILTLMVLTTTDVILRYIIGRPLKGAYELSEILFLSAVFLGMAYTQMFKEHVNADLLVTRLSAHTNLILETGALILAIFIYGLLAWQGAEAFWKSWNTSEYRWGLIPIPLWPARLMIPLGASVFFLRLTGEVILNISKLFRKGKRR